MGSWKKKSRVPFLELPKNWAAFRSPEGTENPAQAQRPGGVGKASESPHSLDDSPVPCGPARSFTGGWWLLMTHQLSLEQSGTSSASLDHRAETDKPLRLCNVTSFTQSFSCFTCTVV